MNSKRIRPGLYSITTDAGSYVIEERHNGTRWTWQVTDTDNYFDPWMGDFDTKKAALAMIASL